MVQEKFIQLAHGGGGQLSAELISDVILPSLGADVSVQKAGSLADAAVLAGLGKAGSLAFTTDSYVVWPLEFPGGDIGKLSICGTVNDLSVSGAKPMFLSFSLVLEEGLELSLLRRVLASAGKAARQAGVKIVTGDTKVVERGGLSGMVINTAGIGRVHPKSLLGFDKIRQGDKIIISGPLGEHGLAVMCKRKGLSVRSGLESDCAPLNEITHELIAKLGTDIHFMRDPTRGGLAATIVDITAATGRDIEIVDELIPLNRSARAAAHMLGLDLLTIANEGKLVAVVAQKSADRAVKIMKQFKIASQSAIIGTVGRKSSDPIVEMVTAAGGRRIVQMPYGEELPRIC